MPKVTKRKLVRWDLFRDGLSSSLLTVWLRCREQFRLTAVEGWRSRNEPFSTAYGTCVHWLLEQIYTEGEPVDKKQVSQLLGEYSSLWKSETVMPTSSQMDQHEQVMALAECVVPTYCIRYAGDFQGHKYPVPGKLVQPHKWLATEGRFRCDLRVADDVMVPIVGQRDGVFITEKSSKPWVFDTKCLSVVKLEEIAETLPWNLQQMTYLWSLAAEGISPRGCVMNIMRRPGQQRHVKESFREFYDRIEKHVEDRKNWDHYFNRVEMFVDRVDIQQWEKQVLRPMIKEIWMWTLGEIPHYMNPNALVTKYGKVNLFDAITRGDFSGCYQVAPGGVLDYHGRVAT